MNGSLIRILATFSITENLSKVKAIWDNEVKDSRISGTSTRSHEYLGGAICYLDSKKGVRSLTKISEPTGFCLKNDNIFVCSIAENRVLTLDKKFKKIRQIKSKIFNDLHSITPFGNDFIITSTGFDAVARIDLNGNVKWIEYLFNYEGYNKTPKGNVRSIALTENGLPKVINTDYPFPTLDQTTHVNGATPLSEKNDRYILLTLFHQGEIILLDRVEKKIKKLFGNLWCPHSFKIYDDFSMVCDTRSNQVILFDKDDLLNCKELKIKSILKDNFNWVQDCEFINNNFYVADSNNSSIKVYDRNFKIVNTIKYPKSWRIHQIKILN